MEYSNQDQDFLDIFDGDDSTIKALQKAVKKIGKATFNCNHERSVEEDGVMTCQDCGYETSVLTCAAEWHYYGAADSRTSRDPSRCHKSKISTRGGIDDVFKKAGIDFPDAVKEETSARYQIISNGDTMRGKGRKEVVAACLLHVLRSRGDIRTADEISKMFGLPKSAMSDGLSKYYTAFPKDRTVTPKPCDLVRRIMFLAGIPAEHYGNIVNLCKALENTSQLLNSSNVQSVASATAYLYLCIFPVLKEKLGLTKAKFADKTSLSDITITKLVKEEVNILKLAIQV